ncbi:hypothetical protein FRC17_000237 [Serendipita sp. 399]|nr:hypothetical protein FRC17_000237 [Serendipita sp. 399]
MHSSMNANKERLLVPTLDILKGVPYRYDTTRIVRRIPSHNDSIDAIAISSGYDAIAKAWRTRYGVHHMPKQLPWVPTPTTLAHAETVAVQTGHYHPKTPGRTFYRRKTKTRVVRIHQSITSHLVILRVKGHGQSIGPEYEM